MTEVISRRTENSKTFLQKDGKFRCDISIGAIHYKDDYAKDLEWKDIDPTYFSENSEYKLYDRMPIKVKVFKNKVGYEVESKKTGQIIKVELEGDKPDKRDVEFEYEITGSRVKLWKTAKTDTISKIKWKVTTIGTGNLKFWEKPEAFDLTKEDSGTLTGFEKVDIKTTKTEFKDGFYWEEELIKDVKIDTDTSEISANDGFEIGESPHTMSVGGYAVACGLNKYYWAGFRFTTVSIPKGATVSSASLAVKCSGYAEGATNCNIYGDDTDDAATISTSSGTNLTSRTQTTNYGTISLPSGAKWGTAASSTDLASTIEEIVGRSGWASGNDICLIFYPNGTKEWDIISGTSGEPSSYLPTLSVTYTEASSTNMQINIGDSWKAVTGVQINIGDSWKTVTKVQINIGDSWKTVF